MAPSYVADLVAKLGPSCAAARLATGELPLQLPASLEASVQPIKWTQSTSRIRSSGLDTALVFCTLSSHSDWALPQWPATLFVWKEREENFGFLPCMAQRTVASSAPDHSGRCDNGGHLELTKRRRYRTGASFVRGVTAVGIEDEKNPTVSSWYQAYPRLLLAAKLETKVGQLLLHLHVRRQKTVPFPTSWSTRFSILSMHGSALC